MQKFRIIVVENDEDERLFIEEALNKSGNFSVVTLLENGDCLVDYLNANSAAADVILSDLNMPGKNGYDVIEFIKRNKSLCNMPVVITSTSSTTSIIERCLNSGADVYMVKPELFLDYDVFAEELYKKLIGLNSAGTAS